MVLDADAAYLALKTRDARFDGRLYVGVTTTGVYCRPVCRVRTPRRPNCRFFASAAQAEAAAFRPCLKCRPEIAPGLSAMDSSHALATAAAHALEHAVATGAEVSLAQLAAWLGVTDRHLRRIFHAVHGVAPHDYLTTQRLLLAKRLLTDTAEPIAQVALASGFSSLRRFNAAFARRYRMPPSRLRRDGAAATASHGPVLRLAWRPPYDVDGMLAFLAHRAVPGLEQADGLEWRRTLAVSRGNRRHAGWLAARFVPERCELQLRVAPTLAPVLGDVIASVRHGFDLDADPAAIDAALAASALPHGHGVRVPGAFDGFEGAVRCVIGQQVSVAAARALTQRLVARFGVTVATPFGGLTHLFPTPDTLAAADAGALARLGIVGARVCALRALAAAVADGRLGLDRAAPLAPTLAALRALPGIDEWTVQTIAMRVLGWPDAWPAGDAALMKALGTRDAAHADALARPWRPWRAYAAMRLWPQLETPR
ncbi:DNA-3-methyladenine glycosylase 2 family protein [Azohydromonas sediminis]|uniref:DNA-3-methyladenine glycosylase 2 family protein n=1 Tax=Azohydromonas sediminis TaxID=2259674 RepID=UPI000E650DE7|nr:AlkA N-terminal domain-containing protein [Azohydromonas sediminis]